MSSARESRVGVGSVVRLHWKDQSAADEPEQYTIVADGEADVKLAFVSVSAPLAAALVGHVVGDEVVVRGADGRHDVRIVSITNHPINRGGASS